MALQIAAHPVVAVARAVGEELELRVEQQPRRLGGRAGDHHQVGRLVLQRGRWRRNSFTPRARPRSSTTTSLATQLVRSSQLPVAMRRGMTVFWVPHLALTSQAKPTQ